MKEVAVDKPNVSVKLFDKPMDMKYVSKNGVFLGKLCLVTYGWNYSGRRDSKDENYSVNSDLIKIKEDMKLYKTEEEAQKFAYKVANHILKNFLNLTCTD